MQNPRPASTRPRPPNPPLPKPPGKGTPSVRKGPFPPPPPMRQGNVADSTPWRAKLIAFLLLGTFVVLVALGMNKSFDDIRSWAKGYDRAHCLGAYDTPQCHQDRADAKAKAYINAKGEL